MLEALFFLVIYIFPLHWAAEFAEAEESNYLKCFILSIVTTFVKITLLILFANNSLIALLISMLVSIAICMNVLKIPGSNFFMFAVMLAFLNFVISGSARLIFNGITGS